MKMPVLAEAARTALAATTTAAALVYRSYESQEGIQDTHGAHHMHDRHGLARRGAKEDLMPNETQKYVHLSTDNSMDYKSADAGEISFCRQMRETKRTGHSTSLDGELTWLQQDYSHCGGVVCGGDRYL